MILRNKGKKLRKRLSELKIEFKKALEENTIEAYDAVLTKAEGVNLEIYEHILCKQAKDQLIKANNSSKVNVEILDNKRIVGKLNIEI